METMLSKIKSHILIESSHFQTNFLFSIFIREVMPLLLTDSNQMSSYLPILSILPKKNTKFLKCTKNIIIETVTVVCMHQQLLLILLLLLLRISNSRMNFSDFAYYIRSCYCYSVSKKKYHHICLFRNKSIKL